MLHRYVYPNSDEVEYTVVVYRCSVVGQMPELYPETKSLRYFAIYEMPQVTLITAAMFRRRKPSTSIAFGCGGRR